MKKTQRIRLGLAGAASLLLAGCNSVSGGFSNDVAFMEAHTPIVLLKKSDAAVAVAPDYLGRVMTSTFDRKTGPGFGWINRPVIEKGLLPEDAKAG